jgi:hypothetical protein
MQVSVEVVEGEQLDRERLFPPRIARRAGGKDQGERARSDPRRAGETSHPEPSMSR